MTVLPITHPPPAPRETVYSYLSRLAATWRTETADLAYDMGAPFKRFLAQDPEAFENLAAWADLDPHQLEELLSWTGVRAGNVRMEFRGEVFVSRALRNPVMRGCPVCLREDAVGKEGPAGAAMVMRGDWQMREVHLCVRHRHPLVPLWRSDSPRHRYDVGSRLLEIQGDILSGALDRPEMPLSTYDLWLDGRLQDGRDDTWFEGKSLFASTTFCRLLGQAICREALHGEEVAKSSVHAAAFDVARLGETAIRETLDGIAAAATGHLDEPKKVFGAMYPSLNRDYVNEDGFAPFCRILRDCILDNWPVAPGQVLLGEVVVERRLHSVVTAAKEAGIGLAVTKHLLTEVGAIPEQDDRPLSRRLFDARAHAELLAEIPTLAGSAAMCKAMGATRREFLALEQEGLLIPRTQVSSIKNRWRIPDGAALVADLLTRAIPVAEDDEDWENLLLARRRADISMADLFKQIRQERLPVGHRVGVNGFHGIVVRKVDVDGLAPERQRSAKPDDVELPGVMSAADFGRSVGLRDHGSFIALIEAGHTPAFRIVNSKTGRTQYRLSADDISSFHGRFATVTTLSTETGLHRNTLSGLLKACGVPRFAPEGQDFGAVYLRTEATRALA